MKTLDLLEPKKSTTNGRRRHALEEGVVEGEGRGATGREEGTHNEGGSTPHDNGSVDSKGGSNLSDNRGAIDNRGTFASENRTTKSEE